MGNIFFKKKIPQGKNTKLQHLLRQFHYPKNHGSYTIKPHHKKSGIQVITSYEDSPIPAKVYVDNKFLGTTPLRTMIPLCAKELRVESKYYQKTQPLSPKEHRIHEFNIQPETLLIEDF